MSAPLSLSDTDRNLLLDIAAAVGVTGHELQADRYELRNADHARGYLEGFLKYADDEKILLAYLALQMILDRSR